MQEDRFDDDDDRRRQEEECDEFAPPGAAPPGMPQPHGLTLMVCPTQGCPHRAFRDQVGREMKCPKHGCDLIESL